MSNYKKHTTTNTVKQDYHALLIRSFSYGEETQIYAVYVHMPNHTPQYHQATLSSCVGCLTAHLSPPGTDPQELKQMTEKTQKTLTFICTQLTSVFPLSSPSILHNRRQKKIIKPNNRWKVSLEIHPLHTVKWQQCCCRTNCFPVFCWSNTYQKLACSS